MFGILDFLENVYDLADKKKLVSILLIVGTIFSAFDKIRTEQLWVFMLFLFSLILYYVCYDDRVRKKIKGKKKIIKYRNFINLFALLGSSTFSSLFLIMFIESLLPSISTFMSNLIFYLILLIAIVLIGLGYFLVLTYALYKVLKYSE